MTTSEKPGQWGSGQVSGPQIEWRTTMVPEYIEVAVGESTWRVRPGSIAEGMARYAAARLAAEAEDVIELTQGEDGVWAEAGP
jgi:hypothetical protein